MKFFLSTYERRETCATNMENSELKTLHQWDALLLLDMDGGG